jgi:hypothetical protein
MGVPLSGFVLSGLVDEGRDPGVRGLRFEFEGSSVFKETPAATGDDEMDQSVSSSRRPHAGRRGLSKRTVLPSAQ